MKRPSLLTRRLFGAILLSLIAMTPCAAAQLQAGERLEYTFSYRGIFSGFVPLQIARAEFVLETVAGGDDAQPDYLATMQVTTEPFGKAEMLYPIRYRYRSWLEHEQQRPWLVSEYLQTDEISEELLWFDRENALGYRYVKRPAAVSSGPKPPRHLLEQAGISLEEQIFLEQSHQKSLADAPVWDYLSMIYHLRTADLQPGKALDIPVYNGKRIKHFRLEVEHERMQRAGWDRPAYKLSLYEHPKKKGITTTIWISDDVQRLPLRFYAERAFGAVDGILQTGRTTEREARGFSAATSQSLQLVF